MYKRQVCAAVSVAAADDLQDNSLQIDNSRLEREEELHFGAQSERIKALFNAADQKKLQEIQHDQNKQLATEGGQLFSAIQGPVKEAKEKQLFQSNSPVSYTHLDVYKRQSLSLTELQASFAQKTAYEITHSVKGDDNYYIIFTSGTTGKPKGCLLYTSFTRLKSLVLVGYLASLLNVFYLLPIFKDFQLLRITDTAGNIISLVPWLSLAITLFDSIFLFVATLGFYKNFILELPKKDDLDKDLL